MRNDLVALAGVTGQHRSSYNSTNHPPHSGLINKTRTDPYNSSAVPKRDMKHYFCDHCKIPGHSIQRLSLIHI